MAFDDDAFAPEVERSLDKADDDADDDDDALCTFAGAEVGVREEDGRLFPLRAVSASAIFRAAALARRRDDVRVATLDDPAMIKFLSNKYDAVE